MPLISNSTVKLVKVTSLLDRPITGTAEYVIYCVDNGVDPKTYWVWKNSAWEEIYTTITDQYIITRQLTGLTITGGTVTSTDTILSAFGKLQNQLNAVASPMVYQGTWNANTNFPILTSSVGTKGHVYRVTTSGATNVDGTTDWKSGDFIVFNGTTWDKWDSTDAVTSVNGYVGNVVLVKSDVGLGNVPNVDATNPANIVQNTNYRFVTDTEKTYWNGKQDALGYVPEDVANKATTMTGNTTSNVKYLTSKAVYDWGTSTFIPLNAPIVGATKTKITYDSKGLVTAGADATTADIADSLNKRYVTDANLVVINNTSNTNTGDETQTSIKTKLGEASATQDGYLSAFYWSAFNNKQSAISLTNIGNSGAASFISNTLNIPVYTLAGLGGVSSSRSINTTAPLQGGGDLSADRTLTITQATTGSSGYLSSTDWNKFNDKQDALSGGILNRITKWTSTTGIGNSQIADDGTSLAIGASLNSTVQLGISTNKATAFRSVGASTGVYGATTTGSAGVGVQGQASGGTGVLGTATGTANPNVGVEGQATGVSTENIGGKFTATGATTNYSLQLTDGTQTVGGGKFLKDTGSGKANWANVTKSDVGLSNVENTALSTWAGTTNITTLGTITTGVWQGTSIDDPYITSAGIWNSKVGGSGTANYIPKWSDLENLTDSSIYDNGGNIGIGTTTSTNKLQVAGSFKVDAIGTISTPINSAGWYRLATSSVSNRGGVKLIYSTTGGNYAPVTFIIKAFRDYSTVGTIILEKYGTTPYIKRVRIIADEIDSSIYHIEGDIASNPNGLLFQVYVEKTLGYESTWNANLGTLSLSTSIASPIRQNSFIANSGGISSPSFQIQNNILDNIWEFRDGSLNSAPGVLNLIGSSSNIIMSWDNTNTRVGIGTSSPSAKIHINNITSSDSFLVEDSTNPDVTPFVIDGSGNVGVGLQTPSTLGRLVVQGNGANGLVLNTDSGTATNSTRLFFRQSDTNDVSMFNVSGSLRFSFGGTANNTSGTSKFVMSAGGSLLINATGSTISPVAPLTAYATGIASTAEEIARFAVYDVNNPGVLIGSTYMSIRNGSTTDSEFLPQLRGLQSDTSTLGSLDLVALSSTAQDIAGNTNPVFLIRSGNATTGGALTNRITFQVRNGATSVIHAAGNNYVSLGNTAPLAKMHVTAGATGVPVLRLERTTTTAQYIEFENSASGNELRSYSVSSAAKPLLFSNTTDTSNTVPTAGSLDILFNILGDRIVTIGADKNVGINVITPSYALEVQSYTNSGIMTYNSTDVSSFITITSLPSVSNSIESRHNISAPLDFIINSTSSTGNDTTTSSLFKLQTFSKDAIVIDNAQKVGFGTAAPSVKVHINSTTSGAFRLVDTTQGAGKYLKSDANGVGTWSNLSVADTGLTLTTTGTSGPATLVGNTLNIPQIATPSLSDVMVVGNNTNDKNIIFNSSYGLEDSSGKSTLKFDTSDQVTITNTKTLVGSTNRSVLLINGSNVETSITAEKVTTGVSIKLATSYVCDTYSDTSVQFVDIVANNAYNTNLNISKSAMLIGSTLNSSFIDPDFRGAEYLHNYASNYTNRSLVDKEYVDTAVSTVTVGTTASVSHTVKAGIALTKGQAVFVSSADGTNMIVSKADYSLESTSSKVMGLIAQNLSLNGIGQVITEGLLAGLDTSTANAGDPVWLGDDGNLLYGLANKPSAPNHIVFIGIVTRANINNGEIFIKPQNGFEIHELHDVSINSIADNDVLTYETATGLWKNKPQAFNYGLSYTVATQNLLY